MHMKRSRVSVFIGRKEGLVKDKKLDLARTLARVLKGGIAWQREWQVEEKKLSLKIFRAQFIMRLCIKF